MTILKTISFREKENQQLMERLRSEVDKGNVSLKDLAHVPLDLLDVTKLPGVPEQNLLTSSRSYKPFRYPIGYAVFLIQNRLHWLPEEIPLADDVKDWHRNLDDSELNLLMQIFRLFTQNDVLVNDMYMDHYSKVFKPCDVRMALAAIMNIEGVHIAAYAHLLDTVGIPETEFSAFLEYKEMVDKQDYMRSFDMNTIQGIAESLVAFGGFTEGVQLFASFAMLMNFPRFNKMKGMGQVVTWSVRDESCFSSDTEVLTNKGWKLFKDLDRSESIAQFTLHPEHGHTFVMDKPLHYTNNPHQGEMIHFHNKEGTLDHLVTPDHDMLTIQDGILVKVKAGDITGEEGYIFPIRGGETIVGPEHITRISDYDGRVYCVTMPHGTVVVRRNGVIGYAGNCHVGFVASLSQIFRKEFASIIDMDQLFERVDVITDQVVKNEFKFIDLAFGMGPIEGLSADLMKEYVMYVTDFRRHQFGHTPMYNIKKHPLPWMEEMMNAVEHTNFFENRGSEYSRSATKGTWEEAFAL